MTKEFSLLINSDMKVKIFFLFVLAIEENTSSSKITFGSDVAILGAWLIKLIFVFTAKTKKKDDYVVVTITDSGKGISDEDKPLIFDRFFRTAEARASEKKGSGLGLAIVKNLANSLNGDVGVRNAPQKGSEFWFSLPVSK